jgi:peroxiredoxin
VIKQKERIQALSGAVLLISYDEPELLKKKMMHDLEVPYPILLDPAKETYARWGMGRTNLFGAMLNPGLNVRYVQLLAEENGFWGWPPTCSSWPGIS